MRLKGVHMVMIVDADRMSRQSELLAHRMQNAAVLIAGAGMLGSWTAMALGRCAMDVQVWDFDTVEAVNTGNQAYTSEHPGLPKVQALEALTRGLPVRGHNERFPLDASRESLLETVEMRANSPLIVVSGVDSFEGRKAMAGWARHHNADVFVDTRAMGEIAVVFIVPHAHIERYLRDEIIDDAAAPDVPCGMNGTAYVGQYVAATVTARLNAHFMGKPVPFVTVDEIGNGQRLREDKL